MEMLFIEGPLLEDYCLISNWLYVDKTRKNNQEENMNKLP